MNISRDIEVQINFFTAETARQYTSAESRASSQFYYDGKIWDAHYEYPDAARVRQGDTVRAYIGFMSPRAHVGRVKAGVTFEVFECGQVVGNGVVLKVLELKKSACRASKEEK